MCQLFDASTQIEWMSVSEGAKQEMKNQMFLSKGFKLVFELPTIAQLVERPTVDKTRSSGGPWFESGLSELFVLGLDALPMLL